MRRCVVKTIVLLWQRVDNEQVYVKRIFSVSGMLTSGRRNRMTKSLAGRVFLRLNKWVFDRKQ